MTYAPSTPIRIGNQTRSLRFTHTALMAGQAMLAKLGLPSSPREAFLFHKDVAVVAVLAAAGLRHESKDVSPKQVTDWLDAGQGNYLELETAVGEALEAAYAVMEAGRAPKGEATAPTTPSPAPTTPTPTSTPGSEP